MNNIETIYGSILVSYVRLAKVRLAHFGYVKKVAVDIHLQRGVILINALALVLSTNRNIA